VLTVCGSYAVTAFAMWWTWGRASEPIVHVTAFVVYSVVFLALSRNAWRISEERYHRLMLDRSTNVFE
jgi:hypothetical protein